MFLSESPRSRSPFGRGEPAPQPTYFPHYSTYIYLSQNYFKFIPQSWSFPLCMKYAGTDLSNTIFKGKLKYGFVHSVLSLLLHYLSSKIFFAASPLQRIEQIYDRCALVEVIRPLEHIMVTSAGEPIITSAVFQLL